MAGTILNRATVSGVYATGYSATAQSTNQAGVAGNTAIVLAGISVDKTATVPMEAVPAGAKQPDASAFLWGKNANPKVWNMGFSQLEIDPALEAICLKAMALLPANRYANARELADDIEHYLADEATAAYAEPWAERLLRWVRRYHDWRRG